MSTNYFVYCVDCQDDHPVTTDHLQAECQALIRIAPALAAFADAWDELRHSTYASPTISLGPDRDHVDPAFFKVHAGHHLVVRNEYGDNDDECGKRYVCPRCEHSHDVTCRRRPGHEGGHKDKRDDGRPSEVRR